MPGYAVEIVPAEGPFGEFEVDVSKLLLGFLWFLEAKVGKSELWLIRIDRKQDRNVGKQQDGVRAKEETTP